ncbi:unnamed protein product [Pelagomonas calceolata]|uniref:SRCR domain-containing protein n=1 Tax=Pelagomonas calceolata TaxID=35677 RepID=A0A7S4ECA1_9STRA|nr:unnamed protein product [Pelagomonas calceolata]
MKTQMLRVLLATSTIPCVTPAAQCSDILYSGTVWGYAASGVALGAYTNNELQFIGCIGCSNCHYLDCDPSTFSCTDTGTGITFGSSSSDDSSNTMRSCHGVSSINQCYYDGSCCSQGGGMCNAPDKQIDATALCQQLGYNDGSVTTVSENGCPESHWDGSTWTSDFVGSHGHGKMYTCVNVPTAAPTATHAPSAMPANKKKRKDDATLVIVIIACVAVLGLCIVGFCCERRRREGTKSNLEPLEEPEGPTPAPEEEATVLSIAPEAEPQAEREAEEPPPPPAKSWWFGRAEPEPEEAERPPPLSPFSTLRAEREKELAFEPEA